MTSKEKQIADKKKLMNIIREEIKKKQDAGKLDGTLKLDAASTVTNIPKFLEAHICIVEANEGRLKQVYGSRLTFALVLIGIDIYELKKRVK